MILEYAQLLSTAHRVLDGTETIVVRPTGRKAKRWVLSDPEADALLYSATHMNHPSAIWARQSNSNYQWLAALLRELCAEYTYRYGKVHKAQRDGLVEYLLLNRPKNIRAMEFTEPTPAMPDIYKTSSSIESYRKYYLGAKNHMFNWKQRETPSWIKEQLNANISI